MYKISRFSIYTTLFLALFFQMTIFQYLKVFGAKPDLLLACVIFFGFYIGPGAGLEAGLVAGALKDVFALDFLGINIFISAAAGLSAGAMNKKLFRDSVVTQLILVFSFTALSMLLHYALVTKFSKYINLTLPEYLTGSVIAGSVYTSLVAIPLFSKFIDLFGLREPEEFL